MYRWESLCKVASVATVVDGDVEGKSTTSVANSVSGRTVDVAGCSSSLVELLFKQIIA
jgi:hypothetical protein